MAKRTRDQNWQTVMTVTAGNMSATFGSTTGTQVYFKTRGTKAVVFRLHFKTLAAGKELRITPKFKSEDNSTTDTPADGDTPVYYPLEDAGTSTEPFGPIDAEWATAELWLNSSDTTAAAVVQMKRLPADG